jgi:hypothetical protein
MVGKPGTKCTICTHRERAAIDLAIVRGISPNAIVKRYGLGSTDAVYRHKKNHLPPTLRAKLLAGPDLDIDLDELRETESQSLLMHLVSLRHRLFGHLDLAEENGDCFSAHRTVSQIHTNLELTAKLLGELGFGHSVTVNNLLVHPSYIEMRMALVDVLRGFPEAAKAVAVVLHSIESSAVEEIAEGPKCARGPATQPHPPLIEDKPVEDAS